MLDASPLTIDHFPAFLARIPAHIDLAALARETKAFRRPRGVRSATDLLRLALAWGPGGHSMQRVAAWAGAYGIASLTEDALHQRLHATAPFLEALTQALLAVIGPVPCWHGQAVRISDGSGLRGLASRGVEWRVHGVYDLGLGRFTHLEVTDNHGGEALDRGAPVAGEIRIADRGFANAHAWRRFLDAADAPAHFIVRMRWNGIKLTDPAGGRFEVADWLAGLQASEEEIHETTVLAHAGAREPPIRIRLIARRKPQPAIDAELERLRKRSVRRQRPIDPRSRLAAMYVVLATSLGATDFPAAEVLAVYRLRWQIELAFKRLKSLLHIDRLRTRTAAGTRCWLYAHLIVALLSDDLGQDFLESFPSGAV